MSGQLIGRGYITIAGLKDGDPAKTYVLLPSVESVTKKLDGTLSVKTVNCSVYKVTGSSAYALTSDHTVTFVRKPDGQTGTLAHPSGATGNVNILAATESVEFELKDGSKVIDRVRVPVLSDATDVNNELDTYNYLKEALEKQGTTMKPGLMLTSFIAVGYTDDSNVRHTQAGMNGIYVPKLGGRTPAAWYGGPMVDRFNADGTVNNSLAAGSYATSLIRMDGSAYFANGNIRFKNDGTAEFGDTANGYGITLGSNGRLTLGNGIDINIGGEAQGLSASISSVTNLANELSNLFTPFNGNTEETWKRIIEGKATYDNVRVNAGFWTESFVSVKGKNPDGGTSGSGTGSGGAYGLVRTWQEASAEGSDTNSALGANLGYSLYSALTSHTADAISHITAAERAKWNKVVTDFSAITGSDSDSIINKWEEVVNFLATYTEADTLANLLGNKVDKVAGKGLSTNDFTTALLNKLNGIEAGANKYVLPTASSSVKGGVKVGSGLTIASEVLAVNLSASHIPNLDWSKITTGKPTTLGGYGITDGMVFTDSAGYVGASFLNSVLSQKAHDTYIELWDSPGWWNLKAGKYIVTGGTASQFLKADGSLDGTAYLPKATFDSMFELVTENGVTSIRAKYGLWTNEFLSCKGVNPNGGTAGGGTGGSAYGLYTDSTWASDALSTDALGAQLGKSLHSRLRTIENMTLVTVGGDGVSEMGRYIDFHTVPRGKEDYIARIDAGTSGNAQREFELPADGGTLATQAWVTSRGYLTSHQSLSNYYTKSQVDAKNYLKDSGDGKTVRLGYSKAQLTTASWLAAWTVDGDAYELRAISPETVRGLMSAYSKTETDAKISAALGGYATEGWVTSNFNKYTLPTASATVKGGVKIGSGLTVASEVLAVSLTASHIPSLPWGKITSGKPTTLAGYGITDAKIANGIITLGGNTITPITSHQSLAAYLSKNEAQNTYIDKTGGDSYHVVMSNGNKTRATLEYSDLLTGGAVDLTNLQPNTLEPLVTRETLTAWDGSYVMGAGVRESALAYCTHGAFGDIVTHNAGEFLTSADISGLLKIDGSNGTSTGVSALINKLGEGTSTPGDNTYYVTSFAGTGTAGTYHRRKHSALWTYIKGKADAVYQPKGSYLTAITKAQVEAVLTGNITSHTHSQYLTSHQSLANYVTLNTAQTITAKKTINILGLGEVSDDWNIPLRTNRLQWLLSSGTQAANAPGTYYSGVSFMTGYVGFQLAVYGSKYNERLYFRKVSDNGTWSGWHGIIHTGTTDMLDTRYYTKTEINTKLTDGSITKVGTASVGNGSRPVYLNAGVPTAGLYAFGINNGNAAIFVPFPTYTTLINGGYLRSDYESAGYPNSDFFKALLCWAGATYPSGGTLIGQATPNARGTCIINLYSGTVDPDTKLPRYGSGIFISYDVTIQPFCSWNYKYEWGGHFRGQALTVTKRNLWGRPYDGSADVSGDMAGVGSIAASGQIKTTSANAFRAVHGNYGFIIRNDGANAHFLLTDSGNQDGDWNNLRPLYINLATGKVCMNQGLYVNGGGGITTNRLNINAASSTAYLTADSSTNAFINIGGKHLMLWDANTMSIRSGVSIPGQVSLGTSSVRWSNVYATTINVTSTSLVGNLNADMVDGVHAADIDHRRQLFTKNDYEHYVVLLWKVNQNDWHRISGRLYTSSGGSSRYNAADIDLWYSRWDTGNSFDKYFRLDTYGSASPNSWKLVTCTYNGESWYALQYKSTQAIGAFFIGTFNSIAFTAVKYYTSYPSTVNNSEINSSIADKTGELSKTHVGTVPYALTSDNVASATRLQTARTLWGQSFNGGANVSGNMTGVGSVASSYGIAHNITDINTSVGTNAYWYGLGLHLSGQNNFVTLGGYFGLKLFSANGMLSMLDNGNVGIGTASPMYRLHVCGRTVIDNVDDYYALWLNKGGVCCDGGSGDVWNNGYGALNVGCFNNTNQTPLIVAYRNGSAAAHTGANRLFAMELLNSGAQLNFAFKGAALMSMFSDGTFYAKTGIWSDGYMSCKGNDTTSDARLKNVLGNFLIDIRRIADAPSIRFAWKDGSGVDVGSTAQYWQKINPCLAHERRDGMLGLQYGKAALLSVIAVAKKTVDIEERVAELERENTELRSRIAALEGRQINH